MRKYTRQFDKVEMENFRVAEEDIAEGASLVDGETFSALELSARNLEVFAERQVGQLGDFEMEVLRGVFAGQRVLPLERVGVYVPGGNFPLVSSLLMGAVPARVAGVKEVVVCTPPGRDGKIAPAMLAAAKIAGVTEMYCIGGVQAIGALAYGTETVRPVDKIVGPGNSYVTAAKKEVYGRVGIDFIAGPSEVMVIADESAEAGWVAADLLAQAGHDVAAVPVLVTTSVGLAESVKEALSEQLAELETRGIAERALAENGVIVLVESMEEAIEFANAKAPEHLELHIAEAERFAGYFRNYGTLFIGKYSAEVFGDYSSGLNHTLPTSGAARYTGGLSVLDFVKVVTTLRTTAEGVRQVGPPASALARLEGLKGHEKAASIR